MSRFETAIEIACEIVFLAALVATVIGMLAL